MNNEQKLIDMVEYLRNKISEESLRQADLSSIVSEQRRQLEDAAKQVEELTERLGEYVRQEQDEKRTD